MLQADLMRQRGLVGFDCSSYWQRADCAQLVLLCRRRGDAAARIAHVAACANLGRGGLAPISQYYAGIQVARRRVGRFRRR